MYILLVIVLLFVQPLHAQVTGRVMNAAGQPLPDVSVTLLQDSSFIAGAISGTDGRFNINAVLSSGSAYRINLSLAGYHSFSRSFNFPDTSFLKTISLQILEKMLGEILINSKKPLVTRKADRYVVNVEDSYLANGQNGLEVLQRSPGIWVSPNGAVRIVGGATVTVMINDVVQRMSSEDLAVFLRSLRSEDISRIEVIPNPPAEFEAASSGGIIHIILKKARKDGLTGTASSAYRVQGQRGSSSAGFSLDYKLRRFYVTAALNGGIDRSRYTGYTDVTYPDQTGLYNYTVRNNDNRRYFFRAGVVYDLHPKHSLFVQTIHTANEMDQSFHSAITYRQHSSLVAGNTVSDWLRHPGQESYTLNYRWKTDSMGSAVKMIFDHTGSKKTENNEVNSEYTDPLFNRTYRTSTPSNTAITSGQLDLIQKLEKQATLSAGFKFVSTNRNNSVLTERFRTNGWEKDVAASDDYRYTEKLCMFYLAYDRILGKTSIKAGLRGEQTNARGFSLITVQSIRRKYFGWFPSFFLSHVFNEKKGRSGSFNYSRRVRRPGFNDLNPYRLQVHDFTVLTGNPDLMPQYTHSFRLSYNMSQKMNVGAYSQFTKNYIAQTAKTIDSIVEYRSKNYPNSTEYGVFAESNFTIGGIWTNRNSVSWYRLSNTIDEIKYRSNAYNLQTIQEITLKKIMNIDVFTQYNSPFFQANARQAGLFFMDIGFTRVICNKRGRLRFAITDIFNSFREKNLTVFNQTCIDFYQKRPT